MMWSRKEIENYFCTEEVLLAYALQDISDDLFGIADKTEREEAMRDCIREVTKALKTLGKHDPWSPDIKVTDEFLDPLFKKYFEALKLPLSLRKTDYHQLARLMPKQKLDKEVTEKLDAIVRIASQAKPRV